MYKYRYLKLWTITLMSFILLGTIVFISTPAKAAEVEDEYTNLCETCIEYSGTYDHVDRSVGAFGWYIAPAQVTDKFLMQDYENPNKTVVVYHFTDADGELWIIDETYLAEMCEVPLEVGQEVQIVMDANGTPDDFYDDFFHDVFVCYDVLTDK